MPFWPNKNHEMPSFFVIGAAKCGTTSLHAYLDLHPDISMSSVKEPRYFCRHLRDFDLSLIGERTAYLALFASGARARGESSTAYSMGGLYPGVAEAIEAEIPDARFIYLVRDPIERARSAIQEVVTSRNPSLRRRYGSYDTRSSMDLERLFRDLAGSPNQVVDPGLYGTQFRRFLDYFPREAFLVVDSQDLLDKRGETMSSLFAFLGLASLADMGPFEERLNTASEKVRDSDRYLSLANSSSLRTLSRVIPSHLRGRVRKAVGTRVERPSLPREIRARLEQIFAPEAELLRKLSGLELSRWSV